MVSSSFVGFDFGFYFWSDLISSQGITNETYFRRRVFHIAKLPGYASYDIKKFVRLCHRRVYRLLNLELNGFGVYCTRVGKGTYPLAHDTCFSSIVGGSSCDIRLVSDCCFNCAVLWLDYVLKTDPVSEIYRTRFFNLNARSWLILYIVNLDYFRGFDSTSQSLGFVRLLYGSLEQLVFWSS